MQQHESIDLSAAPILTSSSKLAPSAPISFFTSPSKRKAETIPTLLSPKPKKQKKDEELLHTSNETEIFSKLSPLKNPILFNTDSSFHAPYIACNEQKQEATINEIATKTAAMNNTALKKVHIGFSVWFNLDILSVTPAQYAIILDIDPAVGAIYERLKFSFKNSRSPQEFVETFLSELVQVPSLMKHSEKGHQTELQAELDKGYGFLSSQEKFLHVKTLCDEGRIFFGQADVTNSQHIQYLTDWCTDQKMSIHTLYISNISEWVFENTPLEKQNIFKDNLDHLCHSDTLLIDAKYPTLTKQNSGPPQRLTVGKLPDFSKPKKGNKLSSRSSFLENSNARRKLCFGSGIKNLLTETEVLEAKHGGFFPKRDTEETISEKTPASSETGTNNIFTPQ